MAFITQGLGAGSTDSELLLRGLSSEAPKSPQTPFLEDLFDRRGRKGFGGNTSRFVELDGATIVEPTAFEPDPTTFRGNYYYNAKLNVLYKKIITRNESGMIHAYWQKVSDS